ncbi:MBOAT family O-acyltransferase [Undibacterium cyanobacteriorum]|uniref:Probable alginate O-acetylase AlgI n=1 Tax=Undibacterium cyanobacteriorum TaxID=3073561 RepID=A0ABY9RJK4_9BURK|nr:MBOAT family O-acyltransferase [Undibacterium sp. 20NA77.5]WMW81389.1 MBOAT family O-acyltransferase [Undibacterium sp. 20NA77.5]
MVFSSVSFLFYFLPIFLVLYVLNGALPWRNAVLLVASLIFYSWGEPQNLPLLLVYVIANYGFGLWLGHVQTKSFADGAVDGQKKWAQALPFALAIGFNLAGLLYYKYAHFALSNWQNFRSWLSGAALENVPEIALPLGISFFSFHAISYLVDVYRQKTKAERSFSALFTYIIMFPQLVAGPIVRFSTVARQLHHRRWSWWRAEIGVRFFCLGLAQKVLIANTVASVADQLFALPSAELSTPLAWLAAVSYTVQIYFDFAGYSLMAIGLGLMCGFSFPRNFHFPYIAQSITEFWRRWHMSLSRWFRDYVYIPLGGNRHGQARTLFNLFLVFVLCGLWHGANWTFVVWGIAHGVFLVIERLGLSSILAKLPRLIRHAYTLLMVILAWVLFRSNDLSQAAHFFTVMAGVSNETSALPVMAYCSTTFILTMLLAVVFATGWSKKIADRLNQSWPTAMTLIDRGFLLALLVLCAFSLASGAYNPFIYFRF